MDLVDELAEEDGTTPLEVLRKLALAAHELEDSNFGVSKNTHLAYLTSRQAYGYDDEPHQKVAFELGFDEGLEWAMSNVDLPRDYATGEPMGRVTATEVQKMNEAANLLETRRLQARADLMQAPVLRVTRSCDGTESGR